MSNKKKFNDPLTNKARNLPMIKSNPIYLNYFNQLSEYALNAFKWNNLPDTNNERFLEYCLYYNGFCLFFKDPVLGYLNLGGAIGGEFNVYRIPTDRKAIAPNGYQRFLTEKDSVIIWNNYLHTPTVLLCERYAYLLYEIDTAMRLNLNAIKTPILLKASKDQRLTMENFQLEYEANVPVLRVTEDFNMENFTPLKLDAPYLAGDLLQLKQEIWDEALITLGYEKTYARKSERENQIESLASTRQAIGARNIFLNSRKQACYEINKMFGLNVYVEYINEGVEENGNLYDNPENDIGQW